MSARMTEVDARMNPVNPEAPEPLDRELIAALGLDLTSIQVIGVCLVASAAADSSG